MRGEKPVFEGRGGRDLPGFYLYEVCVIAVDNVMRFACEGCKKLGTA